MTNRTVLGHIRLVAVFSNNNKSGGIQRLCLMIRRENQIGGVKTHVPSHLFEEQERSGRWPAPADAMEKFRSTRSTFTSDADAADETFPVTQRCIRKATCLIICGIGGTMINNDSGYKFNPGNNSDPWNQYGIVASRTGHQQNHGWDQLNRWECQWLESMVILVCWWQ